jgi:pilus assembly protein Flp/PilA
MKRFIQQFLRDEDGVAAVEYGLLAGLIAVAIIAGAQAMGTNLNAMFNEVAASPSRAGVAPAL